MRTTATTYFALVLAWTWSLWGAAVLFDPRPEPSQSLVILAGGAGPFVAALVLTHWREPAAVQRSFWRRTFDPRPVGAPWWAVVLGFGSRDLARGRAADVLPSPVPASASSASTRSNAPAGASRSGDRP